MPNEHSYATHIRGPELPHFHALPGGCYLHLEVLCFLRGKLEKGGHIVFLIIVEDLPIPRFDAAPQWLPELALAKGQMVNVTRMHDNVEIRWLAGFERCTPGLAVLFKIGERLRCIAGFVMKPAAIEGLVNELIVLLGLTLKGKQNYQPKRECRYDPFSL